MDHAWWTGSTMCVAWLQHRCRAAFERFWPRFAGEALADAGRLPAGLSGQQAAWRMKERKSLNRKWRAETPELGGCTLLVKSGWPVLPAPLWRARARATACSARAPCGLAPPAPHACPPAHSMHTRARRPVWRGTRAGHRVTRARGLQFGGLRRRSARETVARHRRSSQARSPWDWPTQHCSEVVPRVSGRPKRGSASTTDFANNFAPGSSMLVLASTEVGSCETDWCSALGTLSTGFDHAATGFDAKLGGFGKFRPNLARVRQSWACVRPNLGRFRFKRAWRGGERPCEYPGGGCGGSL